MLLSVWRYSGGRAFLHGFEDHFFGEGDLGLMAERYKNLEESHERGIWMLPVLWVWGVPEEHAECTMWLTLGLKLMGIGEATV